MAAEILGCSFIELDEHPEKTRLMGIAFTLRSGKQDGEEILMTDRAFIREQKRRQQEREAAWK